MNLIILGDNNVHYGMIALLNSIIKNNKSNTKINFYLFLEKSKRAKEIKKLINNENKINNIYTCKIIYLKDKMLPTYPNIIEIYRHIIKAIKNKNCNLIILPSVFFARYFLFLSVLSFIYSKIQFHIMPVGELHENCLKKKKI